MFDEALSQDLSKFLQEHPGVTLLQYVDDLLLAAKTIPECQKATRDLLEELGNFGPRVSAKKAQLCTENATYLGYELKGGKRFLSTSHIEAILKIPRPQTKKQVRKFLGAIGYCRLCIPQFAEIARPLYASTGGEGRRANMD